MTKGERIKELREKAGLTQEELAKKLHTTKQTIYKYEKDIITNIPSDRIEELAIVLDSKPEYILGWEVNKVSTSKKIDVTTDILIRLEQEQTFSDIVYMLFQMDSDELQAVKTIVESAMRFSSKEHK